jgi:CDP-glycerol glycerophosphotransferase
MRFVWHSFMGRYNDNPRALHERLLALGGGHQHTWVADPAHAAGFPPGTTTVPPEGPELVEALEAADVVVANTHTEVEWTKPSGAVYLQTWHGTPLKRIHHDVLWAPPGRLERLDRDVARWDAMISPNPTSTPRLRGAFRFPGPVHETGYPRNDVLLAPDRDRRREQVRRSLGIAPGAPVVLYAPTWRDDEYFVEGRPRTSLALDVEAAAAAMGPGGVAVVRLHPMMTGAVEDASSPSVRDASWYPEVADLYLAADALVTDYSSSMFDFALTGRPMLFFAYDLEDYASALRGFYFDFAPEAPGPLVQTSDALIDALGDLDDVAAAFAPQRARFRARYGHLEDGYATERVLDRLFGPAASSASSSRQLETTALTPAS